MTDVPPRWPGQQPPTPAPTPIPAAPEPTVARPAWYTAPPAMRRTVDIKLVIAVLIGLVSVTGAVVAWQSALAGEKATDKDRQVIAETVTVEQARADNEVIVQDARARFADHAVAVVNADLLDEQAERLTQAGDEAAARAASDETAELRTIARRVLEGTLGPVLLAEYVTDVEGSRPEFDEGRLRDDLERISQAQAQVDPVQTVRDANRLRQDSERLDRWLIFMVAAVVLLTLAQITGFRPGRLVLAGAGTAVWIVSSVLAFTGS